MGETVSFKDMAFDPIALLIIKRNKGEPVNYFEWTRAWNSSALNNNKPLPIKYLEY